MTPCFLPGEILLPPQDVSVGQWACLACDQYTSQPDYWQQAEALAAGGPSALNIVLPEVYLDKVDTPTRIRAIHAHMQDYKQNLLTRKVKGYVYLERTQTDGSVRPGLLGLLDLEQYDYLPGAECAIRPTEGTVPSRIVSRLAVREGAVLESPHVMMLADDDGCTLIEPLAEKKADMPCVYEGELALGGGFIKGWAVERPEQISAINAAIAALGSRAVFDAKYPAAAGAPTLSLASGDGNHSLATAKAYWDELKKDLPADQHKNHPARYCLAEVCNLHSPAIGFEPIHRVVFKTQGLSLLAALKTWCAQHGATIDGPVGEGDQTLSLVCGGWQHQVRIGNPPAPLAVGTLEAFLSDYLAVHPAASVDYIHGEDSVRELAEESHTGILLPDFEKRDLFRGVVLGGVLPRKTFSMGHAQDKRYYLECRSIV